MANRVTQNVNQVCHTRGSGAQSLFNVTRLPVWYAMARYDLPGI